MTDTALIGGDHTPAEMGGYGPIPAVIARQITCGGDGPAGDTLTGVPGAAAGTGEAAGTDEAERARVFLRRLFTDPATGIITDCDPRRRRFDGTLAKLLVYRDQRCRDPFCDAPIRHLDHITAHATGGPTTPANGRGVCQRGNHVKQMPGWTVRLIDPARHEVETTTPTGHTYRSVPPPSAPSSRPRAIQRGSPLRL